MYYPMWPLWSAYLVILLLPGSSLFLLIDSYYLHFLQTPVTLNIIGLSEKSARIIIILMVVVCLYITFMVVYTNFYALSFSSDNKTITLYYFWPRPNINIELDKLSFFSILEPINNNNEAKRGLDIHTKSGKIYKTLPQDPKVLEEIVAHLQEIGIRGEKREFSKPYEEFSIFWKRKFSRLLSLLSKDK